MSKLILFIVTLSVSIQVNASVSKISASEACGYLSSIDLNTRGWKNYWDDMYGCSTPYRDIGRGSPLPNNIAYYVDGNRSKAKQVKLVININNKSLSESAHKALLKAAKILSQKVTGNKLSENLISAIIQGNNYTQKLGHSTAKIIRIDWPTGKGYEVKFVME